MIGANLLDSGPNYFGRYSNQAVITRGGRPDIQMAAMLEATKLMILTEGIEPVDYIKAEASIWNLPMLLVPENTAATTDKLAALTSQGTIHARSKIQRFSEIVSQHLDRNALESLFR